MKYKAIFFITLVLSHLCSGIVFGATQESVYVNHLKELNSLTSNQVKEKFSYTELINNNLPQDIEFWTQAYCPFSDPNYSYIIPYDFELLSCEKGRVGSHGGCSTCVMSKIKLRPKNINDFYQSVDIEYAIESLNSVLKNYNLKKDDFRIIDRYNSHLLIDDSSTSFINKQIISIIQEKRNYYAVINGKKYGPYQEVLNKTYEHDYPIVEYRDNNKYYVIMNRILGPYDDIIYANYDEKGYVVVYRKNKKFYINLNGKITSPTMCYGMSFSYAQGSLMYDCISRHNPSYGVYVNHELKILGNYPDTNTLAGVSHIMSMNGEFVVAFFRYNHYQHYIYYNDMIFGSFDFLNGFTIKDKTLYLLYKKGDKNYLKIIQKLI